MIARRISRRRGFTIVELLVAMALIILIMAVLSEAFVAGLTAFRQLKGLGDMQERIRVASVQLRRDLGLRHFQDFLKLSDDDLYWQDPFIGSGDQTTRNVGGRPSQGFFRIQTPPNPNVPGATTYLRLEGVDGDLIPSWVIDPGAPLPVLHFASKLVPDRKDALRREHLWSTPVPPGILDVTEGPPDFRQAGLMNEPWAEIAWFLAPSVDPLSGVQQFAGQTPLYSLYRRARLMIAPRRDTFLSTPPAAGGGAVAPGQLGLYYGVACELDPSNYPNPPTLLLFDTEYSVAEQPYVGRAVGRSMNYQPVVNGVPAPLQSLAQWYSAPAPVGTTNGEPTTLIGDDLVTTDVISFEIKVLRPGDTDFRDLNDTFIDGGGNPQRPYGGIYDTATAPQGWLSLRAIKVVIRVWDFKTSQARQVTIIQDL